MTNTHPLGVHGEDLATRYFEREGWRILARNFRVGHKEIDLVVRRDELVAFVEVKTRTSAAYGHPLEAITAAKRREIERVARAWVARHGLRGDDYRFDAIAIRCSGDHAPVLEHVPNAWQL